MLALKDFLIMALVYGLELYWWIIIIYIVCTFFVRNTYAPWFVFLKDLVDPPLRFVHKITKGQLVIGPIDLSVLILFFAISGAKYLLFALAR